VILVLDQSPAKAAKCYADNDLEGEEPCEFRCLQNLDS